MPAFCDLGFRRVTDRPLLDLRAVPWAFQEPRPRPTIIFPTVLDIAACAAVLPAPLDRFYMYYAPHHSHGIGLATAPHPEGPWTPYAANPVLRLEQVPGLRDHISSPEVVYRPDHLEAPFWMYFHGAALPRGGGQQTCLAMSADGLYWSPYAPEPILTATAEQTRDANTAAYVRIFRRGEWWYGLYKAEKVHCLARSRDGISWEHWPRNPVIAPEAAWSEYDRIRHTGLLLEGDTLYIFYSTLTRPDLTREEIRLATLSLASEDWLAWGPLRRHGTVLAPEFDWEANDLRDPFLLRYGDALYLYYSGGHEQGIGLAIGPGDAPARVLRG
jgi:hypothetical protein